MNRKAMRIVLCIAVAFSLLAASIEVASAYFSDYRTGYGEVGVALSCETEISEEIEGTDKIVSVVNTGSSNAVVRVSFLGAEDGDMPVIDVTAGESDWEKHGEYYYYKKILAPEESTSDIRAELAIDEETAGDSFDIIVVYDSAVAAYDTHNKVLKPENWDYIPDIRAR